MYVDETVLNFMNRPEFESALLKNETIEASIAFIDICGFTSITESEQPNVVVNMLNSYFDVIVKEIIAQMDTWINLSEMPYWLYFVMNITWTGP